MAETVVVKRAPLIDTSHGQRRDWSNASTHLLRDCVLAPRANTEDTTAGRQGVVIGWTLYAPPDADLLATDRVTVRGDDFEINGLPADWTHPRTGWRPGLEVALRAVEG
jgi:hypothetical protein